jgi:hypothetical protein
MAKNDKSDAKKGKDKDKDKDKSKGDKKKGKKGAADASTAISVAAHPRAAAAVKRAKGFGGVGGFALAAYLSHKAGVPAVQVGARALAFGIAGYLVAWACAVTVWRHLVLAEFRAAVESGRMRLQQTPAVGKSDPAPDAGKTGQAGE